MNKDNLQMQKTMICLILDRSGSMASLQNDVVGGVNTFIVEQKKLPDPAILTAVRFDSEGYGGTGVSIERFINMKNLQEVQPITTADYVPRGGTPLLDAIGKTIRQLDHDWQEYQPDKCIVVIYTDGQENASVEFSKSKVKQLIEARQGTGKWGFLFLGANMDAVAEASSLGIWASNSAKYVNSGEGLSAAYSTTSDTVGMMRSTGSLKANWGGEIKTTKEEEKTPSAK